MDVVTESISTLFAPWQPIRLPFGCRLLLAVALMNFVNCHPSNRGLTADAANSTQNWRTFPVVNQSLPAVKVTHGWPSQNIQLPLSVQESRRTDRNRPYHASKREQQQENAEPVRNLEYDYDGDAYADALEMGDAQFAKSHIIHPKKKRPKKSRNRRPDKKVQPLIEPRSRAASRHHRIHRYPNQISRQSFVQVEENDPSQYPDPAPDVEQEAAIDPGTGSGYPMYDAPDVSDVGNIQAQPSSDYEDEADPDYDDGGYDDDHDDDDDDDDSMESRSRTFVASGTGPIPEDMRMEMEDDAPDPREVSADAFLNNREQEADLSIDHYKQQEQE